MNWNLKDIHALRHDFVTLHLAGGVSMAELCRRHGISRKTGYKWIARYRRHGPSGLKNQPRTAIRRRNQTGARTEKAILGLRGKHPTWGPRKLRRRLEDLGRKNLPAVSTCARILSRNGCVDPQAGQQHQPLRRFEREHPNELWQMDFKGHFPLSSGGRCHPLTVLDDCSRYALGLQALANEQTGGVQSQLTAIFQRHGLPEGILCDNGPPWAAPGGRHTTLSVWLLRLGIRVLHGRPYHPQTQGKDERFHRTLKTDLLARHDWKDLGQTQKRFDAYRRIYNHDRPHEALGLEVPARHYQASQRSMPGKILEAEYGSGEEIRTVKSKGEITYRNRFFYVGEAFAGLQVALRATAQDGVYRLCYAAIALGLIDLNERPERPRGHYYTMKPITEKCYP